MLAVSWLARPPHTQIATLARSTEAASGGESDPKRLKTRKEYATYHR